MWLMVDSLAAVVASFYCSITVARTLGPDLMGHYNYVLYFATVLKMVADVAIPSTVRKFAAELVGRGDYTAVRKLVSRALRLQVVLAAAALAVGFAITFTTFPVEQRLVASLAVLSILPSMLLSSPTGGLAATESLRHIVFSSMGGIATNLLGVTVSLLLGWGLVGLTASLLVSRVVDCTLRFAFYRRVYARLPGQALPGPLEPSLQARMIRFAGHQLLQVLLYAVLFDRMEVFFLGSLAPSREIAFFSISFTFVSYLLQIPMNLAGSAQVSVWCSRACARGGSANDGHGHVVRGAAGCAGPVRRGRSERPAAAPALRDQVPARHPGADRPFDTEPRPGGVAAGSVPARRGGAPEVLRRLVGPGRGRQRRRQLPPDPGLRCRRRGVREGRGRGVRAIGFLAYLVVSFRVRLPFRRMARLLVACVAMFVCVRLVGSWLPSLLALLLGIPFGAAVFFALTRWLKFLDAADRARLRQLERLMPTRARGSYLAVVDYLVPA
jgi:O-antigen/teichoic acid export membrane protein